MTTTAAPSRKDLSRFARVPAQLIAEPRWCVWLYGERDGKKTKLPHTRYGRLAKSNDPSTWMDYAESLEIYATGDYEGLMFALGDGWAGVDQDKCIIDGEIQPYAMRIVDQLNTYTEISPSGTGLKSIGRGVMPGDGKGKHGPTIELYSRGRFFTVTGALLPGCTTQVNDCTDALAALAEEFFPAKPEQEIPRPRATINADDRAIIEKAVAQPRYAMLWAGDLGGHKSESEADLALMGRIGFFVDWDPMRMESIFGQSRLADRDKWRKRPDYRQATIDKARAGKLESYQWNGNGHAEANGHPSADDEPAAVPGNAKAPEFPPPIPLDEPKRPELPEGIFTGWFGDMVYAESEFTETPPEIPLAFGLTALSVAVQGRFRVQVKQGVYEGLNTWNLGVYDSGGRKSQCKNDMIAPLDEWEEREAARMAPIIEQAMSERKTMEARIGWLRDQAKKAESTEAFEAQKKELAELEANLPEVPTAPPLLYSDDVTVEHQATLMSQNGERGAIVSDEAGVLDNVAGRYSNGVSNLDLLLQSHTGSPVKVHRGSRPPALLRRPVLTIGLSPQPSVLRAMKSREEFRGRGFLARFAFMAPRSRIGERVNKDAPVPDAVRREYHESILSLLEVPMDRRGDHEVPHPLTLTDEAYACWADFWTFTEKSMAKNGRLENLKDWGGKLPGLVARIAGLLHLADFASAPLSSKRIEGDTMDRAVKFGHFLIDHALIAFDMIGANSAGEAARVIWKAIEEKRLTKFTARDAWRLVRGRYSAMEDIDGAFDVLIDHAYLMESQQLNETKRQRGRPPSRQFFVNPSLTKEWE